MIPDGKNAARPAAAAEIHPQRSLLRRTDELHDPRGRDRLELRRRLGQHHVARPHLRAKLLLQWRIFVILGHGQDVRSQAQKMITEIDALFQSRAHHDLVHHAQRREQRALVVVRQRAAAPFVHPQHLVRGKAHRQVAAQRAGFLEELHMAGMDDVLAAGDENAFQGAAVYAPPRRPGTSPQFTQSSNAATLADLPLSFGPNWRR